MFLIFNFIVYRLLQLGELWHADVDAPDVQPVKLRGPEDFARLRAKNTELRT